MIRRQHVREEIKNAEKVFAKKDATNRELLGALFTLIVVGIKVMLSVRTNTSLLMKKADVKPLAPRKKEDAKKEKK